MTFLVGLFLRLWFYVFSPSLPISLLLDVPQINALFSTSCYHMRVGICIYIYVPKYSLLSPSNVTCVRVSGLTIWQATNCALS